VSLAVADGVDVDLEPGPVESRGEPVQGGLVVDRGARVVLPIEIGGEHRRRPRLDDSVLKQLHRDGAHSPGGESGAPGMQPSEQILLIGRIGFHGSDDAKVETSRAVRRGIGSEVGLVGPRYED
jgi:hypothetical protein